MSGEFDAGFDFIGSDLPPGNSAIGSHLFGDDVAASAFIPIATPSAVPAVQPTAEYSEESSYESSSGEYEEEQTHVNVVAVKSEPFAHAASPKATHPTAAGNMIWQEALSTTKGILPNGTVSSPTSVETAAAFKEWEVQHQIELEKKEAAETAAKAAIRQAAKEALASIYAAFDEATIGRRKANRVQDELSKSHIGASSSASSDPMMSWAKVCDMVDTSKEGCGGRDTSRMRELMLDLKSPVKQLSK